MIGVGDEVKAIMEYIEARHIPMDERALEVHRQKHWTAIIVHPATIEDAKHLNPNVKDINEVESLIEQNNEKIINRDVDKIAEVVKVLKQQERLLENAFEGIVENDNSPASIRVTREVLESKLKAIVTLSKLTGDIEDNVGPKVQVMIQNIVPQLTKHIQSIPLAKQKELFVEMDKKRAKAQEAEFTYDESEYETEEEG